MKGIELAHGYYEDFGKQMLEHDFPDIIPYLAIGFCGRGSEHYGFDDEISKDHDFEPGFCIFLPGEDIIDRRKEFLLERAYAKLPKEYCGIKRMPISPVGGNRHGIIRTADFFSAAVGTPDGILSVDSWLRIPDYALAEAVNGEIWFDGYGEVSEIRKNLRSMPDDIRLKRIAGNLLLMAQAGQYNFLRCIKHREPEAAQLTCSEFIYASIKTAFLLQKSYMPFYKWCFKALRGLPDGEYIAEKLSVLLNGDNRDKNIVEKKYTTIEDISAYFIDELKKSGLTNATCGDLEKHAYSVNDSIKDGTIRNMNILTAV